MGDDADGAGVDRAAADRAAVDRDVGAVADLLLGVLGPMLAWWRIDTARRLGLDGPSFTCLELAEKHGRVTSALVADRTGLTRSAVSKLVRRLEGEGHVVLRGGRERGQALEIVWTPHEARDAELERARQELRRRLRHRVGGEIDDDASRRALVLLRAAADCVFHATSEHIACTARDRRLEALRRARELRGDVGW